MLLFSLLAISARKFGTTFSWIDALLRHLVFLSAFLGGLLATGRKTHIAIDILGKYFEAQKKEKSLKILRSIISFVSAMALIWLSWEAIGLVKVEAEYGKVAFWGIHTKVLVSIIPAGFGLIAFRFIVISIDELFSVSQVPQQEQS